MKPAHVNSNRFMAKLMKNAGHAVPFLSPTFIQDMKHLQSTNLTSQTLEGKWKDSMSRAFSVVLDVVMRHQDGQLTFDYQMSTETSNGAFPYLNIHHPVYMVDSGHYIPQVISFLQNPSALSRQPFQVTVVNAVKSGAPAVTPCHITYLGKGFGYLLPYDMYKDYAALLWLLMQGNFNEYKPLKPYRLLGNMCNNVDVLRAALTRIIKRMRADAPSSMVVTALARVSEFHAINTMPEVVAVLITENAFNLVREKLLAQHPFLFELDAAQCPDTSANWLDYLREFLLEGKTSAPEETQTETEAESATEQAEPTTSPSQPRQPKPKSTKPEALLQGLDADTLYDEVLTNPNGYFACEVQGPPRSGPEAPTLSRTRSESSAKPEGPDGRYSRVIDLQTAIIHSKLAVMEWEDFTRIVEGRRYAAKHHLEKMLGRELNFKRADVVDLIPERLGEVPGLVAGLQRPGADRLCVVRLIMRHKVPARPKTYAERQAYYTSRKRKGPLMRIKTRNVKGKRYRQDFHFATAPMLAIFPAQWLTAAPAETWIAGLYGTPYDPTLLDFCGTMPPEWWAEVKKVIPLQDMRPATLDLRALTSA